jgi:hypothetical protein
LYAVLTRIAKVAASPVAQDQEINTARGEVSVLLGTMAEADRDRRLDDSYDELLEYASTVGMAEKPRTIGEFFEILRSRVGGH